MCMFVCVWVSQQLHIELRLSKEKSAKLKKNDLLFIVYSLGPKTWSDYVINLILFHISGIDQISELTCAYTMRLLCCTNIKETLWN